MNWIKKLLRLQKTAPAIASQPLPSTPTASTVGELTARYGHLYRSAVHLVPGNSEGFSRLGGLPEMPEELPWPEWKEKPMSFLAQISLAELHEALPSYLPSSGFLYFFYDQNQGVWGFDPADLGGWRVFYSTDDRKSLIERSPPIGLDAEFVYRPKSITTRRIDLLPDSQMLPGPGFDWSRDGDAYSELRMAPFGDLHSHQVHGYPTPVQNADMEEECQLAYHGIYVGTPEGYKDPRVSGLRPGAKDWKLLLQLDTDADTGWMWGDVGTLYFWVREQDARICDFSKVWMVFQCC